ncbi:hypothetical protein CRV12_03680 (plasmid) [Candidatus Pantoea edessiphila]|uniref:Resolvase/invertase-type recombinase catalytic domain-containing protein n=2 Tax=Candidatus Pantoea edessiphila TaxID=2044610 RepID=A0A2P5SZ81_9GAMM|nr:hypothetical protein CRV12_03680 [Candidatus Pantoea edessiphila]
MYLINYLGSEDVLVVWKLDRLSGSLKDLLDVIKNNLVIKFYFKMYL